MSVNEKMTLLANAVRAKSGAEGKLTIDGMTEAVNSIEIGGGGGGGFELTKVTEYTPYRAALTAPSQIVISGFGTLDNGTDASGANGTYVVTSETQLKSGLERIYKQTDGKYYLCGYDPSTQEWAEFEAHWYISDAIGNYGWSSLVYVNGETLPDGEATWTDFNYGGTYAITTAVTETTYPVQPLVLKGQTAKYYDSSSRVWVIDQSENSLDACHNTPVVGNMYVSSDGILTGSVVAFCAPFDANNGAIPTGFTSNTSKKGYVIDQSSGGGNFPEAWCIFNQNYTGSDYAWWTGGVGISPENPGWFSIEVPTPFAPGGIFIMNEVVSPENFKTATFQGSNDGQNWNDLLVITDSPDEGSLKQYFEVNATNAYRHFRMYFTESHTSGVSIQAFQIYRRVCRVE